jgi:hypothetical protein
MAGPQGNGYSDNEKRLQRIEQMMAFNFEEHDLMKSELKLLIKSQVLMAERQDIFDRKFEKVSDKLAEVGDKLNGLIAIIEADHREFHDRIKRLEGQG